MTSHDEEEKWEREFNVSWRIFKDAQIAVDQVVFEEEKVKRQSQSAILAAQQQQQKASVTSVDATANSASATEDIPVVDEEAHQQTAVQLEEDSRDQNESPAMISVDAIRRASSSVSIHSTPTTLSTVDHGYGPARETGERFKRNLAKMTQLAIVPAKR